MKEIPLTQGLVTIVDDEDYEWLNQWKWCADKMGNGNFRVARMVRINGKQTTQYMHRLITDASKGYVVDHINGDTLDNRRANLRVCTNSENIRNMHNYRNMKRSSHASKYKGVYWHKRAKKWCASIMVNGKSINLGRFDSELDAALAYDAAAMKYFKEFARPNFSRDGVVGIWDTNTNKISNLSSQTLIGNLPEIQTI